MTLVEAAERLNEAVRELPARAPVGPVAYILNPLDYAWENHATYLTRFAPPGGRVEAVFFGMNPGPWGMAQTGVPFGTPDLVREFLRIDGPVRQPARTHPARPIEGVACHRNEVSGQRFWGTVRDCFGTPERFFARFFVANYCPLVFQKESGANLTPDRVPRSLRDAFEAACDDHLVAVVETLHPRTVIGIGKWVTGRAQRVLSGHGVDVRVASILHPSPASPAANRGWRTVALGQLEALGHPWPTPSDGTATR